MYVFFVSVYACETGAYRGQGNNPLGTSITSGCEVQALGIELRSSAREKMLHRFLGSVP